MTLKKAIEKAEQEIGGKVIAVGECKDRWILCFDFEKDALTSIVRCCYKETGELGYFFPPDEPGLLKSAKPVDLPKDVA